MDQRFEFVRRSHSRIVVGAGVAAQLLGLVRELGGERIVVLHDAALTDLAPRLAAQLGAAATLAIATTPSPKTLAGLDAIATRLHECGADRKTTLVAVGGGTITDLVGFVASVYLRGVPFVSCPTTTLGICDAALGGKNGVDHSGLKNRLGTIRQPDLILCDVDWLQSLPDELFREGLVEVVKKAAVLDAANFARLEALAPALLARETKATIAAIEMAVAMKMRIVLDDETESDRRRALNFGHTIGHAIESLAAGSLRHGECVAMGMLAECRAAAVPAAILDRLGALLKRLGVPTAVPPAHADAARLWDLARHDKKATRGSVPMYVPSAIGAGRLVELTPATLQRALS